eukprot:2918132-Rhodomonas_salina.1
MSSRSSASDTWQRSTNASVQTGLYCAVQTELCRTNASVPAERSGTDAAVPAHNFAYYGRHHYKSMKYARVSTRHFTARISTS